MKKLIIIAVALAVLAWQATHTVYTVEKITAKYSQTLDRE